MKARVVIAPQADRDIDAHFLYISRDNVPAAKRLVGAIARTLERLAQTPGVGVAYRARLPALRRLRRWVMPRYRNYIIYYRPIPDGIEVVRVLHAARDQKKALREGL